MYYPSGDPCIESIAAQVVLDLNQELVPSRSQIQWNFCLIGLCQF